MSLSYREYTLDDGAVDAVSAAVQDHLNRLNTERRSVQRIRLTVEELLLSIRRHYGAGMKISVGLGKQFGRHLFRLRYEGEPFDPSKSGEDPAADDMMRALGLFPAWSCRGRTNTVSLVLSDRPKRSALLYIFLAVLAAAALGAFGGGIPESARLAIIDSVLTPVSNGFLGLLNTFAGLMILLTICSGILGMGDIATLGRTGKSIMARFIGISLLVSAASVALALPFVSLNFAEGGQGQTTALEQISRMFFDILPGNVIDPFRTGNTFHIIVIAILMGCALLAIGERGSHVRTLINESAILFQHIVSAVCALVPLVVFSMLLRLIWSGQAGVFLSVLKPILLIVSLVLVLTAAAWLLAALRLKCSPILLMKKVLPPFLVAFTTASSVSALQLGMETCEKKLGVGKSLTAFVYPLGSVAYMPSSVVYFTVLVCAFAEVYQVAVSIPWLFMAVVISALIAIAMPPIPGADILCYTVLFSNLGIPSEAVILATTVGILFDYLCTGTNVMHLILRIVCDARRLDRLDRAALLAGSAR